jgi:hypothetical protein
MGCAGTKVSFRSDSEHSVRLHRAQPLVEEATPANKGAAADRRTPAAAQTAAPPPAAQGAKPAEMAARPDHGSARRDGRRCGGCLGGRARGRRRRVAAFMGVRAWVLCAARRRQCRCSRRPRRLPRSSTSASSSLWRRNSSSQTPASVCASSQPTKSGCSSGRTRSSRHAHAPPTHTHHGVPRRTPLVLLEFALRPAGCPQPPPAAVARAGADTVRGVPRSVLQKEANEDRNPLVWCQTLAKKESINPTTMINLKVLLQGQVRPATRRLA